MSKVRSGRRPQAIKKNSSPKGGLRFFIFAIVALIVASLVMGFNIYAARPEGDLLTAEPTSSAPSALPEIKIAPPQPLNVPTVGGVEFISSSQKRYAITPLVGIVSGHRGYDPGAVCPDGLTEAEINYRVALEVVDLLQRQGVNADLLEEFDPRLTGYLADALVSVHADSCNEPGATGFKVARVTESAIPEAEDLLVACLNDLYGVYTGLPFHPGSITDDMTNYHAFRETDNRTPGAIIEIGFMLDDRYLLETKPKIIARGIAAGILCFLDNRLAPAPPGDQTISQTQNSQ
jgi:N-acetylmuramoyl-L-alanine amidase